MDIIIPRCQRTCLHHLSGTGAKTCRGSGLGFASNDSGPTILLSLTKFLKIRTGHFHEFCYTDLKHILFKICTFMTLNVYVILTYATLISLHLDSPEVGIVLTKVTVTSFPLPAK
jgi:hypothetical protein